MSLPTPHLGFALALALAIASLGCETPQQPPAPPPPERSTTAAAASSSSVSETSTASATPSTSAAAPKPPSAELYRRLEHTLLRLGDRFYAVADREHLPTLLDEAGRRAQRRYWSPDGTRFVYVQPAAGEPNGGRVDLWISDAALTAPELLVRAESDDDRRAREAKEDYQTSTTAIRGLAFSAEGKEVYFEADAWSSVNAIQAVDVSTKKVRFVVGGGGLVVIPEGPKRGSLLVSQWRTKGKQPANDHCAVFDTNGKELASIGWYEDGSPDKALFCTLEHPAVKKALGMR
ncbi:MAG: hypothetical protein HOV80_09870 [Polyangiaceae bacterium]|nr:hypothetical protein [Polyangiaceae bacterium]